MSESNIIVELKKRDVIGKGLGKLRSQNQVPAVLHNHGKNSLHVMGDYLVLLKTYNRAGKHHPVELKIDGKQQLALIKDADFDPKKHSLRHIVFQSIKQNEKTTAEVPVVLVGDEIPAEKKSLLILTQLDTVEVEALPRDLPDELTVDATKLEEVGDHLYVSDIKIPNGVVILTEAEASLAVVEMPKDQIAEADAAAAALAEDKESTAEPDSTEQVEESKEQQGESQPDAGVETKSE